MNKKIPFVVVALIVLVAILYFSTNTKNKRVVLNTATDYKNAEYVIDGKNIKLTNGVSEISAAPGSASKIVTRYFGNEVRHDLNGDGREDVVFLLTQNTGGSGTFYYVVAAINTIDGYVGTHGLFLGDRIAPQTTEMSREAQKEDVVIVNYADRGKGESFAVQPSIGKSIWLKFDAKSMQFGEVVQNFEGEADPSVMTLSMKKWTWVRATYSDGKIITPKKSQAFTITFTKDGKFSATTDCNGVGGEYTVLKNKLSFNKMMSTLMFCEGSEESIFTGLLNETQSYLFTSKGELILELKLDSGQLIFR